MEQIGAYKGDGPWDDDLRNIEKSYKDGIFVVGELKNKLVAIGAIRKIDNDTCELKRMRTEPGHQGKGFGKMILTALIKNAKQLHFRKIILETSDKQIAAHKLSRNTGFREFKKEIIDGFNCTWYELNVNQARKG